MIILFYLAIIIETFIKKSKRKLKHLQPFLLLFLTYFLLIPISFATLPHPSAQREKHSQTTQITKISKRSQKNPLLHRKHNVKKIKHARKSVRKSTRHPIHYINRQHPPPYLTKAAFVKPSRHFFSNIEDHVVNFVYQTVSTLKYSVYKLGGKKFDTSKGIYIVDCSAYIGQILSAVYPNAYSALVGWSGSQTPTSYDYYHFFTKLDSQTHSNYWSKVPEVEALRPGDILVFRYKNEKGGHVMIVMNKPMPDEDNFIVRVADSASVGHSKDTRHHHVSGIGIGDMQLKINPRTYQPAAYAWKVGARWKRNVNFAMARPLHAG